MIQKIYIALPLFGKNSGCRSTLLPLKEDKIVRFADKDRHQIFIEPEGVHTEEMYLNGISSSLPFDVQLAIYAPFQDLKMQL